MKSTSKVCSLENRPGHSSLGSSFKPCSTASNANHSLNNGGEGASKTNSSNNNCDTDLEAEDTMIVKREGVLVTDLLYRLHRRSNKLVDTHVICMDGYIPVHRCVLMACSNFLRRLLIQEDPAELACICLPDYKVSQVIPLINSFYTGCVTFNKSDLNTILELIAMLKTEATYNFQPAKDQDKKWAPKMRHFLENKEVNSESQSTPGGSSSKQKCLEKSSIEATDGEKSNQSFGDDLSPESVDNIATIEVDIEEIDDPEFPVELDEESDDDIKILEILSAEPVISDVTEVAEVSLRKNSSLLSSNRSGSVIPLDDESSNEPYDEYVFSPTDVDLATNVIVRQAGNSVEEEEDGDEDDNSKDPLELESLVFDKDFAEVQEDFQGRSYEFETIAFDETGQHKQFAQILTEPVPLAHARTDFVKSPKKKAAPKAKRSRAARGRKKSSAQLKRLDPPPPLLFEENILGSATPPHLRRKSFEKMEEQKSRMEDIRFSNQLQKQLQMSLEFVAPDLSTARISNVNDGVQPKSSKRLSIDDLDQQEMIKKAEEERMQKLEQEKRQREKEDALLRKFELEKRQRDEEEKRLRDEEDNRLREERRLKEEAERREREEEEKRIKELSEEKDRRMEEERLRKEETERKRSEGKRDLEKRLKDDQARRKALEAEKRKQVEEEAQRKAEEQMRKEAAARTKAEEEKRLRLEESKKQFAEEEKRRKDEENRLKLEEEKRLRVEEEKRRRDEEEKRRNDEEEKRLKLEMEKRLRIEEARKKAQEEKLRKEEERRQKQEERRLKEEARLKKIEEERVRKEQEERQLQEAREREERRLAEEEAIRKQKREEQVRREAEDKRLKEERRKEKEARRKRDEEKRLAEEERQKQLEIEKRQQAEREREEEEQRRKEESVRIAIEKAEEALNQQIELERKRREAEETERLEAERRIIEEENRKKREDQERIDAERRERERIEEEKRVEEELAMQIEKDMQKFDYEISELGVQKPKKVSEETPTQQPKSTPFFEEFVKRKQKILEEEKRRRQAEIEEQQRPSPDSSVKSKGISESISKPIAVSSSIAKYLPKPSAEIQLEAKADKELASAGEKPYEITSENLVKTPESRSRSRKSSGAERVQEQLKSINLSVEVEEIVEISSRPLSEVPELIPHPYEAPMSPESATAQNLKNVGASLSIMEETHSGNQQVYEFVDDIPVAETEIELTGDGFAAETEVETETVHEVEVETQEEVEVETHEQPEDGSHSIHAPEVPAVEETIMPEESRAVAEQVEANSPEVMNRSIPEPNANPPSPFIGEDLSLTCSSPDNGLQIVEIPEEPKPKSRSKKKKNRKVREKQTQVKPQMISVLKNQESVIVHTAEQSRRSSRSSESSRRSPEPMSLNAAARTLMKHPKKPVKIRYGSSRVTLQNPKIIISRLPSEEYKYYSVRLQRYKRMRPGTPPPTLPLASPEAQSTSQAMGHWKTLQKDVTASNSKRMRSRDSVDEAPPLLEPQLPANSKQKRSGVTPVGIENFPTVSQPACITNNDLEWYQKELKRCAHCKKKFGTHSKASSCLLNHGFRRCLICLDLVSSLDTSYELHYAKHHSVPKHRGHVACPICGKLLLYRGLQTHVTRKHLLPNEQSQAKTPEFHSQNLSHHFYYPPPPQEPPQFFNQYPPSSFYQPHQYPPSDTNETASSVSEPQVEPLVLDLKKIQNHSGAREQAANLSVRLSDSEEEDDHSEAETLDGSDDGKSKDSKASSSQNRSTGSVLKDTNKEGSRSETSPEAMYAFKEPSREIPIELIPNPTTLLVDAELARRAYQQHFQVEKMSQPQQLEKPPTPVSQLTIEKTPIVQERQGEPTVQQPQPLKRTNQDFMEIIQPRKKYYQYNEQYPYESHHRATEDNQLQQPRLPYFPIATAPSHIPTHHHDFFRPMNMHNPPPYPQSHHPHMHAHLPHHQQPSSHSSHSSHSGHSGQPSHSGHSSHSMGAHNMDNEFPIINPGITVDESSGSVLCELMPVNYHASPIPLQQPYNSNGPKGPSAVPAPMQDMYETGNNLGINRPSPSIFSTPPLSNTPSSTSSNTDWSSEDTGHGRHHHLSHHSSLHQNIQSHHHHHQHQQWAEPLPAHRNESVISINMEYMKIAESMEHQHQHHQQQQHHQQHQQHSDGSVQCSRCKTSFYTQEHLVNHRCGYDMH